MSEEKKQQYSPQKGTGMCDTCEFYDYDEFDDSYTCLVSLDQDEFAEFAARKTLRCPYYRYYDEYTSVHKQI